MHDRHWVGRNRGKNLNCWNEERKNRYQVNPYVKWQINAIMSISVTITDCLSTLAAEQNGSRACGNGQKLLRQAVARHRDLLLCLTQPDARLLFAGTEPVCRIH